MIALIFLALNILAAFVKSKSRLEAENAALRQQVIVLQRKVRGRVRFSSDDRLFFVHSIVGSALLKAQDEASCWHDVPFARICQRVPHCKPP
jgi:hypothetical protein